MIGKVRNCVLNMPLNEGQGHPHDSSGYGNNGTNYGADWVSGDFGWAMEFIGANSDYISCGNPTSLDIHSEFTLMSWVKGNGEIVFNKRYSTTSCSGGYMITLWGNGHGNVCVGGISHSITNTVSAADGNWHHIALTYTGSKAQLYLDGAENGHDDTFSGDVTSGFTNLNIGRKTTGSHHYTGLMSEPQIYNRVWSTSEMLSYFNATKARYGL